MVTSDTKNVGWIVLDDCDLEWDHLQYLQVSELFIDGTLRGVCVLVLKPSGLDNKLMMRVGIGYIWALSMIAEQPKQVFAIA